MKRITLILLCFMLLLTQTAFAESAITVDGEGAVYIPADTAIISLGVDIRDADVKDAQKKANEIIARIREVLTNSGVGPEDINTDYIRFYAIYDYSQEVETIREYQATSTLAIRTQDMSQVGTLIDLALEAGANSLNGISFSASDTSEAEKMALQNAIENAREKSLIIAEAAGLSITGIDNIISSSSGAYEIGNTNFKAMRDQESSAATVVQAAKLCVSANVTIVYHAE